MCVTVTRSQDIGRRMVEKFQNAKVARIRASGKPRKTEG